MEVSFEDSATSCLFRFIVTEDDSSSSIVRKAAGVGFKIFLVTKLNLCLLVLAGGVVCILPRLIQHGVSKILYTLMIH